MEAIEPQPELEVTLPPELDGQAFSHDAEVLELFVREMQTTEDPVTKETAFMNLFHATEERIRHVIARKVSDKHRVDDVMNETYSRVWKHAGKFEFRSTVNTWLFRIATNTSISHVERINRVNSREYLTSFREEDGDEKNAQVIYLSDRYLSEKHDYSVPQPENHVIENENSKVITEALGKLSKKYAEVVILREIVGMSHAEIATKLGISESASKVRTHRAMKKLRDLLVEQGDL